MKIAILGATGFLGQALVRPPRIVETGSTGQIAASESSLARIRVNVTDLACFMLDQTTDTTWCRRAPLVATVPAVTIALARRSQGSSL